MLLEVRTLLHNVVLCTTILEHCYSNCQQLLSIVHCTYTNTSTYCTTVLRSTGCITGCTTSISEEYFEVLSRSTVVVL